MLLLSGCGSLPFRASVPLVRINVPVDGATYERGASIAIVGMAGGAGVRTVRILVDGAPVAVQDATEMTVPVALSWIPDSSGVHVVNLEALDVDGTVLARSDMVLVHVKDGAATATSTTTATPIPSATATLASATATSTATVAAVSAAPSTLVTSTIAATPTRTPTPTISAAMPQSLTLTIIVEMAILRSGPGFAFPVAAQAPQNTVLPIVGRDSSSQWWQVQQLTRTLWIAASIVETEASERDVPVVAEAPPGTVTSLAATETASPAPATPTAASVAGEPPCNENNPHWAVRESRDPGYTFCSAIPFEFVEQNEDGRMVLRWHLYGIEKLELRIDPNGSDCGLGTTGFRDTVLFKMDAYELNRRNFPRGGYKIGLWATLPGGRVQDYGELNFCGEG